jgi:hypothetical protein
VAKVGMSKAGGTISQQAAVNPWLAADAQGNKQTNIHVSVEILLIVSFDFFPPKYVHENYKVDMPIALISFHFSALDDPNFNELEQLLQLSKFSILFSKYTRIIKFPTRIFIVFQSLSQNVGAFRFQPHIKQMSKIN